jgi:hypothetical protein
MLMNLVFLMLLVVPIAALIWRIVVSKTRQHWIRVGAAGAAMLTAVGAFVIFETLSDFSFKDWRADIGLAAASTGSIYLLLWAQRHKSNRRHRTLSIIAAIIGLVPIAGAIATGLLFGGQPA